MVFRFLSIFFLCSPIISNPVFVAPEVVTGSYSFPCDVWSFGIVIGELCCNSQAAAISLPSGEKLQAEYQKILDSLSAPEKKILERLLADIGRVSLVEAATR